jgi:steroid delta-isomerase-like uncharacterized protein
MKTILCIASLALVGCQAQTARPDDNARAIAQAMFDAFNQHDWSKMAGYYAADAEFLDPSYGKDYVKQTRQELVEKYAGMQQMFPDIKDDITAMHVAGETVIIQFTSHGSAPDGPTFQLPIVTVLTVRDGLITRDATYYDLENE